MVLSPAPRKISTIIACFIPTVYILLLWAYRLPQWETNDDVAMSMVAHGYGLAAFASPHLVFSNIVWGYFVSHIPSVAGVFGYSLATAGALIIASSFIFYFMLRLGTGLFLSSLAIALIMCRPLLFPQFTLNAGLLAVAAILGLLVNIRCGSRPCLWMAVALGAIGFLIRSEEAIVVFGVALPFLAGHRLEDGKTTSIALALLVTVCVGAVLLDRWAYSGNEWQYFKELNAARAPFTDYGAVAALLQKPEVLARHGYSENDVRLVGNWLFVDEQIASPSRLKILLAELGPLQMGSFSWQSGINALTSLLHPVLAYLFCTAIALAVLTPNLRVTIAWVFCLAGLFALGVAGRPSVFRVYIPIMSLLIVLPLTLIPAKAKLRRALTAAVLAVACFGNAKTVTSLAASFDQPIARLKSTTPEKPVYVWGGSLPFEFIYSVLKTNEAFRHTVIYPLGTFSYAPFSALYSKQLASQGLIEDLKSEQGALMIADANSYSLLDTYCREHFGKRLNRTAVLDGGLFEINRIDCGS